MYILSSHRIILINIIFIIFLVKINSDNDVIKEFNDLTFPKVKALDNGYILFVTLQGIYSYNSNLLNPEFSYNFTDSQKFSYDEHKMRNNLNQVGICQFSAEEGGNKYVIIYANNFIYILSEKGEKIFFKELEDEIEVDYPVNLMPNKYYDGSYYFVITYNTRHPQHGGIINMNYYKIAINQEKIELISHREVDNPDTFINPQTLSSEMMIHSQYGKIFSCFVCIRQRNDYNFYITAFTFSIDTDLNYLMMSNPCLEPDLENINTIKTTLNEDKTKAFVCYSIENLSKVKCLYFYINENKFYDVFITENSCNSNYFGINLFYFKETQEFIFSCIDNEQKSFYIKRVDNTFTNINDECIYHKFFANCYSYNYYSIIYYSKRQQYLAIAQSTCNGGNFIRAFELSNYICMPIESKITTTFPEIHITTIPNIITTLPIIEKTILLPKSETTIPDILSTKPKIISETTIPQVISTFLDFKTDQLCSENKKYSNGSCICDKDKGYFSFNYGPIKEKCYKKHELPKNVYFNNITQSYEFCYKTCGTCNKGGNSKENNCLTCSTNYIIQPYSYTNNCVENCIFLYYYDSLNQYSCTDEKQCPQEASLIIREKGKCVNKCSNDDTHTYQYNGECFSACPIDTHPNVYNICQIKDITNCTISDSILNLEETINQDNVKIAAKNYANEFQYALNHISRYYSQNYSMVLYKNSSCIDQLKLNITKIEYDSCIRQLKIDNNINENDEIIIAVIDIKNGDNPITTFGFFNSETGEKLDASKSCSNKNVIMYENVLNILNEESLLNLIKDQKINIFDLKDQFYNDICFHFKSPNGKDATLQDRIKTFYPNVTLCGNGCKNKGLNITSMKIECDCHFQDLLSNNLFENKIIGDNILIKESVKEIMEMISNLNIEVLTCYKDVFDFKYFKKNKGGFIILFLIFSQIICFIYYYLVSYIKVINTQKNE